MGDVNGLMSDELRTSYSTLQSSSAGHSLLNSPSFNLLSNMQPSALFLFSTPVQRHPSSVEPTVPQPEPLYLRGRDQIPGPSKVSTDQMPHALRAFLSSPQPTCPCRFRCRGVRAVYPFVPRVPFSQLFERSATLFRIQNRSHFIGRVLCTEHV